MYHMCKLLVLVGEGEGERRRLASMYKHQCLGGFDFAKGVSSLENEIFFFTTKSYLICFG